MEVNPDHRKWLILFFIVEFSNILVSHAADTVIGPAQPFLAERVDTDIAAINFLWTAGK